MDEPKKNLRAIERGLTSLLARNRPYFGGEPDYGVVAKSISSNGHELVVELTFKQGVRYCCIELGCHLSLFTKSDWARLHQTMKESGADVVGPLTLRIETVLETGSFIAIESIEGADGKPTARFHETAPSEACRYSDDFVEADCD